MDSKRSGRRTGREFYIRLAYREVLDQYGRIGDAGSMALGAGREHTLGERLAGAVGRNPRDGDL